MAGRRRRRRLGWRCRCGEETRRDETRRRRRRAEPRVVVVVVVGGWVKACVGVARAARWLSWLRRSLRMRAACGMESVPCRAVSRDAVGGL